MDKQFTGHLRLEEVTLANGERVTWDDHMTNTSHPLTNDVMLKIEQAVSVRLKQSFNLQMSSILSENN